MPRRRLPFVVVGIAAVVLLCLWRGGDDEVLPPADPPGAGPPPAGPPAAGPPAPGPPVAPPPGSPDASPSATGEAGAHVEQDDEEGIVTGTDSLDAAAVPAAIQAAEVFADRWSAPGPEWPDDLLELVTPDLAAALTDAAGGPPPRDLTGAGYLLLDAPQWARVGVPAHRGTIVLDVVLVDGQWLVSALAWWPEEAP